MRILVNGRRKRLTLVGVVLSPEYVYQAPPGGALPDFARYGVLWMGREALAEAYEMEGAFNDLVLTVARGAHRRSVIDRLDLLLEPYGGQGAYGRQDQLSDHFVTEELRQLRTTATAFPAIFPGVAACRPRSTGRRWATAIGSRRASCSGAGRTSSRSPPAPCCGGTRTGRSSGWRPTAPGYGSWRSAAATACGRRSCPGSRWETAW